MDLFSEYREKTDSIIQLRCFRSDQSFEYDLVELPTSTFAPLDGLSVADAQRSTIPILRDGLIVAKVRIDRSDAKITVTGVPLTSCVVHGRWTVPNLSGQPTG